MTVGALESSRLSLGGLFCRPLAICPEESNSGGLTQLPHGGNRDINICVGGQLQGLSKIMQRAKFSSFHLVGTEAALLKSSKMYLSHAIKI